MTARILSTIVFLLAAFPLQATTYYIAANGSDSQDGREKTHATGTTGPWLHAPGMPNCSNSCASTRPAAGDQFIFRGGDTWHRSNQAATVYMGGQWSWTWSGSAGNNIYIGVDKTWFTGGTWIRPLLSMDNPITTALVPSCAYPDDSGTNEVIITADYVTFDNFEHSGKCWAGTGYGGITVGSHGLHILIENNYVHGWTAASTATDDSAYMFQGYIGNKVNGVTGNEWAYNVIDGSDSTWGNVCTNPACVSAGGNAGTGWAITSECYNVHHNVIRHVSNGIQCNTNTFLHDNLMEYQFNSGGKMSGRHGNVLELITGAAGTSPNRIWYAYNNVVRYINEGVTWWPGFDTGYIFNNVFYGISNSVNCIMLSPIGPGGAGESATAYVYNNTLDDCNFRIGTNNSTTPWWASGPVNFDNNHFINYTFNNLAGTYTIPPPSKPTINNNLGNIFQTESAAKRQGYTAGNSYSPTSRRGSTVGAAKNLASSCATFSSDSALCKGTSLGVMEAPGSGGEVVIYPAITINNRPGSGVWDTGAYEFIDSTGSRAIATTDGKPAK